MHEDIIFLKYYFFLEHKVILGLLLLPHLFNKIAKTTAKSASKVSWCPSQEEVLKTFVYHIQVRYSITLKLHLNIP